MISAAPPLLFLQNIYLTFGGSPLFSGVNLSVSAHERVCLVGRNGSGKSTLLKIAAGLGEPDSGEIFLQPGIKIEYLPQEPDLSAFSNVLEYVESGLSDVDNHYEALRLLNELGLDGTEKPFHLSGGEVRRAALAKILASQPDIFLLDEPTNHLDLPAIEWLEKTLLQTRAALVLISHDRRFLQTVSNRTVWLDRGETRSLNQGFSAFEEWRDSFLEQEEQELHKLGRKIVQEEHWLRYGVTARRKRNQGRMRSLQTLRQSKKQAYYSRPQGEVSATIQNSGVSGKLVLEAKNISKSYNEISLVHDFSLRLERGDKLGIVGRNGAGKSTLVHLLTGDIPPDEGHVRVGTNLEIATLDQTRDSLNAHESLASVLTQGRGDMVMVGDTPRHVVSYMKDFLFQPEQAQMSVGMLSGGERGRLMLARAFAMPSNLLVLDEPTNDLDLETLDLIPEILSDYQGTVIIISHDRDFLDRVVTSLLVSEGDGLWNEYAGGYSDMLIQRGCGIGAHRVVEKEKSLSAKKPIAEQPISKEKPKRLTYKDQFAYDTLPKHIEKLSSDIAELEIQMAMPDLFNRDPKAFARIVKDLEARRHEMMEAEEELTMLWM